MNCQECNKYKICSLQPQVKLLAKIIADKPFNVWLPMSQERKIKKEYEIETALLGVVASNCKEYSV